MPPSGIEASSFQLVAHSLNQLHHHVSPPHIYFIMTNFAALPQALPPSIYFFTGLTSHSCRSILNTTAAAWIHSSNRGMTSLASSSVPSGGAKRFSGALLICMRRGTKRSTVWRNMKPISYQFHLCYLNRPWKQCVTETVPYNECVSHGKKKKKKNRNMLCLSPKLRTCN